MISQHYAFIHTVVFLNFQIFLSFVVNDFFMVLSTVV